MKVFLSEDVPQAWKNQLETQYPSIEVLDQPDPRWPRVILFKDGETFSSIDMAIREADLEIPPAVAAAAIAAHLLDVAVYYGVGEVIVPWFAMEDDALVDEVLRYNGRWIELRLSSDECHGFAVLKNTDMEVELFTPCPDWTASVIDQIGLNKIKITLRELAGN